MPHGTERTIVFELLMTDDSTGTGVAIVGLIVWLSIILLQVILFIAALVSILSSKRYTGGGKFLWVGVVFFAPFLGPIGWFIAGRTAQIRTLEP